MQLDSPAMTNIFLARHFALPVCNVGGKHYIVARAYPQLPLGLVLEITDVRHRLLGDFFVIDWEAELLELVTSSKTFRNAVTALREDEAFDFTPAFSQVDVYTIMLKVVEDVIAHEVTGIEPVAAVAREFYDKCIAAEALDLRMINDTLPSLCMQHNIKLPADRSLEGWREPLVKAVLFMAHDLVTARRKN